MIQEVPEMSDGIVIIDRIVREGGYRTKLTVRSTDPKVDPVGACVGMRGVRVKNVVRELNGEKVDIIPFSSDPVELLQNALAPIEIRKVNLSEEEGVVSIVVDDDNFAAVIGKKGLNARLCGQLIGYELKVKRMGDYNLLMAIQRSELASVKDPTLDEIVANIEGINSFVVQHLATEKYTLRRLLTATPEELTAITGISREMAEKILEQVRKQRM
jgi:N utilization substance protein A